MIHVVIPAAGSGSRFVAAGRGPKPHVLVDGVPMLRRVVANVRPTRPHRVTVLGTIPLPDLDASVKVVDLDRPTSGAVETILAAGIDDGPLLVANCDQLLGYPVDRLLDGPGDVCVATFAAASPAHSYVRLSPAGLVSAIAEKIVISDRAVAGVYWFRSGAAFAEAAERVLADQRTVRGEYYVSTVLAEMLTCGARIGTVHGPAATLGTPEELDAYHARAGR